MKEYLKVLRKNPVKLETHLKKKTENNAVTNVVNNPISNPISNLQKSELRAVEREAYHEQLASSGKVQRNTTEVCVSRPAKVDVQV